MLARRQRCKFFSCSKRGRKKDFLRSLTQFKLKSFTIRIRVSPRDYLSILQTNGTRFNELRKVKNEIIFIESDVEAVANNNTSPRASGSRTLRLSPRQRFHRLEKGRAGSREYLYQNELFSVCERRGKAYTSSYAEQLKFIPLAKGDFFLHFLSFINATSICAKLSASGATKRDRENLPTRDLSKILFNRNYNFSFENISYIIKGLPFTFFFCSIDKSR